MISLRLERDLEIQLNQLAKQQGKSRSELIKISIREYISKNDELKTPYEKGKDLFGIDFPGTEDLSTNRKKNLKEIFQQKHEKRRSN